MTHRRSTSAPDPVDRSRPPRPGPVQTYRFPELDRHRIRPGLQVIPVHVPGAPLVELELLFPSGAARDPDDRPGLAAMVSGLLDEGTADRDALEIAASIERIGGRLEARTDWNVSSTSVCTLSGDLDAGLDLLTDVSTRPAFPDEEVERARRNRLTDLLRRRDMPALLAADHLNRTIYGDTTYGRPLVGTPAAVRAIRRADLVGFYRSHYRLAGATLLAAGALEPDRLVDAVAERLGAVASRPVPEARHPEAPVHSRVSVRIVDRPASTQTALRLGHPAVPRHHPSWDALMVLNTLFGGKFTSRINLNLRERHGLTYGVSSRFIPRLGQGPFVVDTAVSTAGAGLAVREILREMERLRREPVGEDELAETKSYMAGVFPYTLQTVDGILYHLRNLAVYELPDDHYAPEVYTARLDAVDREEILRVAWEHLQPAGASVVAVGPAAELKPQLEDLGELEVVDPGSMG